MQDTAASQASDDYNDDTNNDYIQEGTTNDIPEQVTSGQKEGTFQTYNSVDHNLSLHVFRGGHTGFQFKHLVVQITFVVIVMQHTMTTFQSCAVIFSSTN